MLTIFWSQGFVSCYSIFYFYVYVLLIVVCPFVLFLLPIVLSVLLRYTDSDYPFDIFKLFWVFCEVFCISMFVRLLLSIVLSPLLWSTTSDVISLFKIVLCNLTVMSIYCVSGSCLYWLFVWILLQYNWIYLVYKCSYQGRSEARIFFWCFVWKITILRQKILFFPIRLPPLDPPLVI